MQTSVSPTFVDLGRLPVKVLSISAFAAILSVGQEPIAVFTGAPTFQPPSNRRQADDPKLPDVIVRPPENTTQGGNQEEQSGSGQPEENTSPPVTEIDVPPDLNPAPVEDFDPPTANQSDQEFGDIQSVLPDLDELLLGRSGIFNQHDGILRSGGSVFDSTGSVSVRTREEILRRQAPDMFHALQNEVGVLMQATAAGQASPFVRGLTGQQVLILIDGIRLNNSFFRRGPNQYFNTIDPGMVDHIEVMRGQGSVLWGSDAIGGVINVVTRGPNSHYGMFHSDYTQKEFTQYFNTANSSPYSRMNVEGWVGDIGLFGGGSYQNVRDLDTGFDEFSRQPGTNYQQYAGDLKFNFLLTPDSMLTLALQHYEQEDLPRSDRFPGYPLDRNNSNTIGGARFFDPQQRDLVYLRLQCVDAFASALDLLTFTASYHRQREMQTRGIPTVRVQETDVESTGLQIVGSRDFGDFGKWTSGVDWYHDDVDSIFSGASGPIVPDDAWYRRAGWFLNWEVPLTTSLHATAGVRYESIETAGSPIINGVARNVKTSYEDWISQVGLIYECHEAVRLFGSISEGWRAPNLDDLMANNPNVLQQGQSVPSLGLVPESSLNYEVGVKTNGECFSSTTSVFWLDLNDNIVSITAAPNTFASANQDSFVQGVEFSGDLLLCRNWNLYGNFWYIYGENEITGAPLSRIPPTQGILGLRYTNPANGHYASVYTWMSDNQDRLDTVRDITDERIPLGGTPGFATLNARLGRTVGAHRLSLSLENITDKAYLVHGSGLLGTGFTARFGYGLQF